MRLDRPARAARAVRHRGGDREPAAPADPHARDARVTTLYEGTSQIQKLLIGRALTGENAFT